MGGYVQLVQFLEDTKMIVTEMFVEQFGEAFGAIVRKFMDTRYSVILHHAIRLVDDDVWVAFSSYIVRDKIGTELSIGDFKKLLKRWRSERHFSEYEAMRCASSDKLQFVYLFDAAINCIPDEDIESLFESLSYMMKKT
jgi:hypothetical protein